MPDEALVGKFGAWLTSLTRRGPATKLTAVGVIVEDVIGRVKIATWRNSETNWVDNAAICPAINIGVSDRFEPLDGLTVVLDGILVDFGVGWLKVLPIHDTWNAQGWIFDLVGREWLIERIITDDVRIASESVSRLVPERYELIIHVVGIAKKCTEASHALLGVVVVSKHDLKAILDEEISVIIDPPAEVIHVIALSNAVVVALEEDISNWVDAGWVRSNDFLSIEVRDAFTTHVAGIDILMSINKGVDTGLTHLVNESLNSIKIGIVVLASLTLNTFPHDTETDKVHTP